MIKPKSTIVTLNITHYQMRTIIFIVEHQLSYRRLRQQELSDLLAREPLQGHRAKAIKNKNIMDTMQELYDELKAAEEETEWED